MSGSSGSKYPNISEPSSMARLPLPLAPGSSTSLRRDDVDATGASDSSPATSIACCFAILVMVLVRPPASSTLTNSPTGRAEIPSPASDATPCVDPPDCWPAVASYATPCIDPPGRWSAMTADATPCVDPPGRWPAVASSSHRGESTWISSPRSSSMTSIRNIPCGAGIYMSFWVAFFKFQLMSFTFCNNFIPYNLVFSVFWYSEDTQESDLRTCERTHGIRSPNDQDTSFQNSQENSQVPDLRIGGRTHSIRSQISGRTYRIRSQNNWDTQLPDFRTVRTHRCLISEYVVGHTGLKFQNGGRTHRIRSQNDQDTRYLTTGSSYRSLGFSYRIGFSTVGAIVRECCEEIWKTLQPIYMTT
nr:unnamed protein product [Callosobruchus analis]